MPFVIEWVENCSEIEETVWLETPVGKLALSMRADVITQADWDLSHDKKPGYQHELQPQLTAYWLNPKTPVYLKLLKQGSDYRNKVWAALCQIPLGETLSYSELAAKIGSAPRPVGNACRDNPWPLFIPCHRVVSASGIGGYCGQTTGDFMAIKTALLAFEGGCK
ncbi:MAG: methylated-DNA--[protein]-cysteine S-methyltransferase [Methylovulum sp.]